MRFVATLLALCALAVVPDPARATVLGIDARGFCPLSFPPHLYLIDEETGTSEELTPGIDPIWQYCGTYGLSRRPSTGDFYTAGYEWADSDRGYHAVLIRIAPDSWTMTTVGSLTPRRRGENGGDEIRALAFSPNGALFAVYALWNAGRPPTNVLARINPNTGAEENRVVLSGGAPVGIEFSSDGTLYGWNPEAGLLTINPATGAVTDVSPGTEDEPNVIASIAFAPDGTLYGFPSSSDSIVNDGWIYSIDRHSGAARRAIYMGPGGWPQVDGVAHLGRPLRVFARPPRRFDILADRLFLIDCLPCPQCFGRMCDPRVNVDLDRLYLIEPKSGVAEIFGRAKIGLRREDGPLKAGAPLKIGDRTLFVLAAPLAGKERAGAILFLDAKGTLVHRIDGTANATLGLAVDVRGSAVVVASAKELLRLDGTKVVARLPFDKSLRAQQALRVAFTDDIDGDKRPDILLGAPYATAKGLKQAGVIQTIGSKTGKVLKTEVGKVARQHLGFSLPR